MIYTRVCCSAGDRIFSSFARNFLGMTFTKVETAQTIAALQYAGDEAVSQRKKDHVKHINKYNTIEQPKMHLHIYNQLIQTEKINVVILDVRKWEIGGQF